MITAKVGGSEIPLYLGMKAVTAITKKYGSLAGLRDVLADNTNADAQNEATFYVAHQLNVNASILEENAPSFKNADILEAALRPHEHMPLFTAVCDAIKESCEITVQAEFNGNEKN